MSSKTQGRKTKERGKNNKNIHQQKPSFSNRKKKKLRRLERKLDRRPEGFDVMDPMFLFVGRLAVQKGPDLLLEVGPTVGELAGVGERCFGGIPKKRGWA